MLHKFCLLCCCLLNWYKSSSIPSHRWTVKDNQLLWFDGEPFRSFNGRQSVFAHNKSKWFALSGVGAFIGTKQEHFLQSQKKQLKLWKLWRKLFLCGHCLFYFGLRKSYSHEFTVIWVWFIAVSFFFPKGWTELSPFFDKCATTEAQGEWNAVSIVETTVKVSSCLICRKEKLKA